MLKSRNAPFMYDIIFFAMSNKAAYLPISHHHYAVLLSVL